MSKQQCMTWITLWIALWYSIIDQVIPLSLPLKSPILAICPVPYTVGMRLLLKRQRTISLSKLRYRLCDVVFLQLNGTMVCSQTAAVWWQASLRMKSFLLTSRCMFVRKWPALWIMEGLTAQPRWIVKNRNSLIGRCFWIEWKCVCTLC